MGDSEKSCTLQSHHKNLQALYQWEATHPLSPRGCHSQSKIWILLKMLAQGQASFGKHLKAFLKNSFSTFTFHKICKHTHLPWTHFTMPLLYTSFHFCNSMYCYVCNLTLFFLKWAYLQSIQNYIKLAEESQEDSKLISPSIPIYESWCKCEIDHCVIVILIYSTNFCVKGRSRSIPGPISDPYKFTQFSILLDLIWYPPHSGLFPLNFYLLAACSLSKFYWLNVLFVKLRSRASRLITRISPQKKSINQGPNSTFLGLWCSSMLTASLVEKYMQLVHISYLLSTFIFSSCSSTCLVFYNVEWINQCMT